MQRLAYFSRERLQEVTRNLHLEYERGQGYLVLLRSRQDLAMVQPGLTTLTALGTRHAVLDAEQCRAIEPGLAAQTPLHAGIHLPDDEVGNCRQFALLLRREAEQHGVRFVFDTTVQRIEPGRRPNVVHMRGPRDEPPTSTRSRTAPGEWAETQPQGPEPVERSLRCGRRLRRARLGSAASPARAEAAAAGGLRLLGDRPVAPHRIRISTIAPRSALMDERYKVAISRLGDAHPRRRQRRIRRRRRAAPAGCPRDALQGARRLVPRRRADAARRSLEGRTPDAARRAAGARRERHRRRLAQPRARLAAAGRCRAARRGSSPTRWPDVRRRSTSKGSASSACADPERRVPDRRCGAGTRRARSPVAKHRPVDHNRRPGPRPKYPVPHDPPAHRLHHRNPGRVRQVADAGARGAGRGVATAGQR